MKSKSTIAKLTSLTLLVATLTIYAANRMDAAVKAASDAAAKPAAPAPSTDIDFGAIKLGQNQNALIIVVCATDPTSRDQRPVDVEFTFSDWDGDMLASETKTILPGHASVFDIRAAIGIPGKTGEIQPSIKLLVDPSDPRAKRVNATLEVTDSETGTVQSLVCRKAGKDQQE